MSTVYIIYSKSIDRFYIGSCLNFSERLKQHNSQHFESAYTRVASDWELYYRIVNLNQTQAIQIEKHIKRMKSRKYILNLKRFPAISQKLKLKYVGSSR